MGLTGRILTLGLERLTMVKRPKRKMLRLNKNTKTKKITRNEFS
jgi:hypothetical protein